MQIGKLVKLPILASEGSEGSGATDLGEFTMENYNRGIWSGSCGLTIRGCCFVFFKVFKSSFQILLDIFDKGFVFK